MEGTLERRSASNHLTLGCGTVLGPGVNVDARNLPGVMVGDVRDLSRFADGQFLRVESRDVIEHLPYRDVPDALTEWLRVLRPGGSLWIQTPDVLYAASLIDTHGPTRLEGEDHWLHFNRVMFGHQDYPENFHASYWSPGWLTGLLIEAGARNVRKVAADVPGSFRLAVLK